MLDILAALLIAAAQPQLEAPAAPTYSIANRKGGKRVGGTGSSGKGGHYVGGRKSTAKPNYKSTKKLKPTPSSKPQSTTPTKK